MVSRTTKINDRNNCRIPVEVIVKFRIYSTSVRIYPKLVSFSDLAKNLDLSRTRSILLESISLSFRNIHRQFRI